MSTQKYIDTLLQKYLQAPSFPFDDWATNPVSFYAIINLWDEIFKTAAGPLAVDYEATHDLKMDPDGLVYDVSTRGRDRRVTIAHEPEGGTFLLISKEAHEDFRPQDIHLGSRPDRSWLEIATDLNPERLCASFDIIREYLHTPLPEIGMAEEMNDRFIVRYRHVFGYPDFDPFKHHDAQGHYVQPPDDNDDD